MLEVLIVLLVVSVALYLWNTYVPAPQPVKMIVNVVVVILALLWLLAGFGALPAWHSRWR